MGDREELLGNLRQLLELDRGLGIEFVGKGGLTTAPAATRALPAPVVEASITSYVPTGPVTAAPPAPTTPAATARPSTSVAPTGTTSTPLPAAGLAAIAAEIATCRACGLCATRNSTVPGEGDPGAALVFVGEGPGADEDAQGRPFVGAAGQLLDKMINAMGFRRDQVFICNVVKCRPPGNRTPEPDEVTACMGYLHRQLAALKPQVICTLGNTPLRALLENPALGITRLRGTRQEYRGIPLIPTFHPSYLLRNPEAKKPCWEDLKVVLSLLGREVPKR
jgi:DNA polymerase